MWHIVSSSTLESDIDYSHGLKVGAVETKHISAKAIVHEFCLQYYALIYPEGGAWYSKLFMGRPEMVHIKGGAIFWQNLNQLYNK